MGEDGSSTSSLRPGRQWGCSQDGESRRMSGSGEYFQAQRGSSRVRGLGGD